MESTVLQAFLVGMASAVSLPLGTLTTLFWKLSNKALALLMAFGAGALLAALTIDLVVPSLEAGEYHNMALGCVTGSLIYLGLNHVINSRGGFLRKTATTLSYFSRRRERKFTTLARSFKRIPFLKDLPEQEIRQLAAITRLKEYPPGSLLYRKGDGPARLFIVDEGTVQLLDPMRNMEPFLRLGPGGSFSRMAFVTGTPNATAARTDGAASVWIIEQEKFFPILATAPRLQERLAEFLAESNEVRKYLGERHGMARDEIERKIRESILAVRHAKAECCTKPADAAMVARAAETLRSAGRFPMLAGLPEELVAAVAPHLELRRYGKGEVIYRFSEYADRIYLLDRGRVEMIDQADEDPEPRQLGPGDLFGAFSMLTGSHHAAAAMAVEDCEIWILKRQDFDALVARHGELATRMAGFLASGKAQAYLEERQNFHPDIATQWTRRALGLIGSGSTSLPTAEEMNSHIREHKNAPLAIWLGIFLDGIPESLVIGAMMTRSPMISLSLLAGLFLSNYPEALSSSAGMRQQGMSFRNVLGIWGSLTVLTGIGAAAGNILFEGAPPNLFALTEGIAAGAMLTVIAETMLPEAYLKGGSITGLTTLLGFLAAILFKEIGG